MGLINANGRWGSDTRSKDDYWVEGDNWPQCGKEIVVHKMSIENGLAGCTECPWCETGMKFCIGGTKYGVKRY
mgnify:CR=1 FL=1